MAKKTLTLLLNIGTEDAKKLGLKKTAEGEKVSVTDDVANELIKRGWASTGDAPEPEATVTAPLPPQMPDGFNAGGGGADDDDSSADESPVSDTNAADAIDQIGRMRSKDRIQHVIDNDKRATVVAAARKRLGEL